MAPELMLSKKEKVENIKTTLCKLSKKQQEKYRLELEVIINNPKFKCKKCKREAAKKKWLCKPKKID